MKAVARILSAVVLVALLTGAGLGGVAYHLNLPPEQHEGATVSFVTVVYDLKTP
jgi:galactokinase